MNVAREVARLVQQRAGNRCEYCRMHQALQGATFHVEHILPRSQGGHSIPDNLAWACPSCNLHKSDRIAAANPLTGSEVLLFNPRRDDWAEHFAIDGFQIVGLTDIGRATLTTLEFNGACRVQIRKAEAVFKLFPP